MAMYLFPKKRHMHLAFKLPISDYESFVKVIDFVSVLFANCKIVHPCLISSIKWKFGNFEKKKKMQVIGEIFTKKLLRCENFPVKKGKCLSRGQKKMRVIVW